MSYAGHVFDMIARMKYNNSLLKKQSYFRQKQKFIKAKGKITNHNNSLTKEELLKVKKIVKLQQRKETRASILAATITIAILIVILWWILQ